MWHDNSFEWTAAPRCFASLLSDVGCSSSRDPLGDALESDVVETVATFRDLAEAEVARMTLDSAGISCRLVDDELIRIDWALSTALGGIKLLVRQGDRDAAEALLSQLEVEGDRGELPPFELVSDELCPRCGSEEVAIFNLRKKAGLVAALLGFPVFVAAERLRCESCGHVWREEAV